MRKVVLVTMLILGWATMALAQVTIDGPSTGGAFSPVTGANLQQGQTQSVTNTDINTNVNVNAPDFRNNFNPTNRNIQGQHQGQIQDQGQGQSQMNNWSQTYIQERELPNVPLMFNQVNPLIQGGVGFYGHLPKLKIKRLATEETVIKVLKTYNGWFWNRICIEDVTEFVIAKGSKLLSKSDGYIAPSGKIRFQVYLKNKAKGIGTSGGVNAVMSGLNGGSHEYGGGAGAQLLPGYNASWADPTLTVEFYEIE